MKHKIGKLLSGMLLLMMTVMLFSLTAEAAECSHSASYKRVKYTDEGHYTECTAYDYSTWSYCSWKSEVEPHTMKVQPYGYSSHINKCTVCDYSEGFSESCKAGDSYEKDSTQHWQTCAKCGTQMNKRSHSYDYYTNKCVCGLEKHVHSWKYDKIANGYKATCTGTTGECEFGKDGGTVTMSAPTSLEYDKNAKEVVVKDQLKTNAYVAVSYAKSGTSYFSGKPTDAGTYTAALEVRTSSYGSTVASGVELSYTIKKAKVKINSVSDYVGKYDGQPHGITVNASEGAKVVYNESSLDASDYNWSSTNPKKTNVGEYTVYYKLVPNDTTNYEVEGNAKGSAKISIKAATLNNTNVKVANYVGTYDGKAHVPSVEAPAGTKVEFSIDNSTWYDQMMFTAFEPIVDVCENVPVYFRVTPQNAYKDNFEKNASYSGTATVTIKQVKLEDYLNISISGYEGTYNRLDTDTGTPSTPHSIDLDVSLKNSNVWIPGQNSNVAHTIEYREKGTEKWSPMNPRYTNAGTYTVEYRIYVSVWDSESYQYGPSKNYNVISGEETVVINKADLPILDVLGYWGPYNGLPHNIYGFKTKLSESTTVIWSGYSSVYDNFDLYFTWTDEAGVTHTEVKWNKNELFVTDNSPAFVSRNVDVPWSTPNFWDAMKAASGHEVRVKIVDTEGNYNDYTDTFTVKITWGRVGDEPYDDFYDAQYHTFGLHRGTWARGSYVRYNTDGSSTYGLTARPERREVGRTDVWYKVVDESVSPYFANANDQSRKYNFAPNGYLTGESYINIKPIELTITANDNTITYGDAPADNGYTVTGWVGEDAEALLGPVTYVHEYVQYGNIGTYKITPVAELKDGNVNYTLKFVDGTLTVEPKEIGITWGATEFAYDGNEHIPTATATGLVNGDECVLTVTADRESVEVGDYVATVGELPEGSNYKLPEEVTTPFKIVHKCEFGDWHQTDIHHWKECKDDDCDKKDSEGRHEFKWVIDKEPTATEAGSKHEECTICGYKRAAVEIPATPVENPPATPSAPPAPATPVAAPATADVNAFGNSIAGLFASLAGICGVAIFKKRK